MCWPWMSIPLSGLIFHRCGYQIDYLTFGGIYREVSLRVVPPTFIENIFARPKDVLSAHPTVDVECFLRHTEASREPLTIEVALRDGERVVAKGTATVPPRKPLRNRCAHRAIDQSGHNQAVGLDESQSVHRSCTLLSGVKLVDQDSRRIGFREAIFTEQGFSLNGKVIKLRGLDRHQTFPFVGQAMPGRAQRSDANILRKKMHCNIVRTSHYPQSRHFLDACDEMGLLVLEEIPGWQHIGDEAWKLISIDNVSRMIRRDWNHPSVILWGVRINESLDDHDFYTRTNAVAHKLDPSRQTGGIRYFQGSEISGRCVHYERFRIPADAAQPLAVFEHGIRGPHLSDEDHRSGRTIDGARAASCADTQSACFEPAICGWYRLVRVRLQHSRRFRLG